ncbi:MAG: hypothetical protein WBA36_14530 [Mesorhizobium sp.]
MNSPQRQSREHARKAAARQKMERLDYVRQMLRELRDMVEAEDEQFLTYLIALAHLAASDVIREKYENINEIDGLKAAS